ncbi:RraA family protein [Brevundimonas pondensis]|nr:hypothetical protein [Brevundimonas pondensis]
MVNGGGSLKRALVGDNLAKLAIDNGWAGIVVHGAIRDSGVINTMQVGVKAVGTIPLRADRDAIGEIDIPTAFWRRHLHPRRLALRRRGRGHRRAASPARLEPAGPEKHAPRARDHAPVMRSAQNPYMTPVPIFSPRARIP